MKTMKRQTNTKVMMKQLLTIKNNNYVKDNGIKKGIYTQGQGTGN